MAAPPRRPRGRLAGIVQRNIQTLIEERQKQDRQLSAELRIAGAITRFAGSMPFVYLHLLLFGGWLLANLGLVPGLAPWDPFPFTMLAVIASVEAIFLSTFVLISQNLQAERAEDRSNLDLQISLLSEHEITRLIHLVDAIAERLGVDNGESELQELKQDVRPEAVLREIDAAEREREQESG